MRKRTKRRLRHLLGAVCVSAALLITSVPIIKENNKKEAISKFNDKIINEFNKNNEVHIIVLDRKIIDLKCPENIIDNTITPYSPYRLSSGENIDGILYIDSIDLQLPIFSDNTDENLKYSVCKVPGTGIPGSPNYCVMGHNMNGYGVIFNRLPEVDVGEKVIIQTITYDYHYTVVKSYVSKGLDTDILKPYGSKCIATLYSCDNSLEDGRRIVVCKLEKVI